MKPNDKKLYLETPCDDPHCDDPPCDDLACDDLAFDDLACDDLACDDLVELHNTKISTIRLSCGASQYDFLLWNAIIKFSLMKLRNEISFCGASG